MVTIDPASEPDLQRTSALHERALDSGLFPSLGRRFLRHYHRTFVRSPHAVALVAHEEGEPIGFVFGTVDNQAHQRWVIRRHGWRLALAGILAMMSRPRVAVTFLRTRVGRYARALVRAVVPSRPRAVAASEPTSSAGSDATEATTTAVLTHIATEKAARSRGIGEQLATGFVAEVADGGADEARLIATAGGRAARFYARLGWRPVTRRAARDGSDVEELRLSLPVEDA